MTRTQIEDDWPLVLRHRAAVVRFLETKVTAASDRRKVSRRALIDAYDESRDIPALAAAHGLSLSGVISILTQVVRVARGFESGTLRQRQPRTPTNLTLTHLPPAFIRDLDAWAKMRGKSRREAAQELVRIGLDVTSARVEKQVQQARAAVRRARERH